MKSPYSLLRQHTTSLTLVFLLLELGVAVMMLNWLVLPLARRAADDLAGLVVLSAQTWAELPPETRPDFLHALRDNHQLDLQPAKEYSPVSSLHPPFVYLFEQAINQRLVQPTHLLVQPRDDEVWYWVNVPAGGHMLAVGWPESRIKSQPLLAIGLGLLLSMGLAWWSARWLAQRVVRPLSSLNSAMVAVGKGHTPALLPEDGPEELSSLSHQFNVMAQQVQVLLTSRTTLLAGISHDLRTPLTRMRLTVELLRDNPNSSLLSRLEREIDRMNALIAQVMELGRGLVSEPPELLNVHAFLSALQEDFQSEATPLVTRCAVDRVWAAPMALRRTLSNLIQNAQRYAAGHSVTVVCEPSAGGVRIGVLDQGPGIPAHELERVQQPFQRLESSRSLNTGGYGLGLAIVKSLANANGWALQWDSPTSGGLHVWLDLPQP
ncbi:MAG: hypothetical protein RLZ63_1054 [Pseudomonadota bacterium]|jgi:two-component system osmolarity sensor histidine kinase EnvZ